MVQGHVDGIGEVLSVSTAGGEWRTRIAAPPSVAPYLVERGSVAVDGVSLTLAAVGDGWFEVTLIPATLAKTTLRDMIGVFVERMGEMSQSTSDYPDRIGDHARRIDASQALSSFRGALGELMVDMRQMQADARRARDEVAGAREQAEAAEQRIRSLQTELEGVSGKLREDALTGSLNRRGLDEPLAREVARASRYGNPLSIGVIDIDNFKRLNDTYGHQTGDRALIHLVRIVQSLLRPTDTIGRFGGEEFVIVLPETTAEAGQRALERLQRELTREFFLANNERLLITFSGGVAQLRDGEGEASLVARADEAMYRAKQAGKNRVRVAARAPGRRVGQIPSC